MTANNDLAQGGSDDPFASTRARPITLALQGGGSHGAFTWGVLDRLLEEAGLEIEAISGASAPVRSSRAGDWRTAAESATPGRSIFAGAFPDAMMRLA